MILANGDLTQYDRLHKASVEQYLQLLDIKFGKENG